MTRAGLLSMAFVLLLVSAAQAWSSVYSWDAVPGATSYKVERSTDNGATWVSVGTPTAPTFTYTGTEVGLTLLRVTACNGLTCTTRLADGLWHNQAWQPLGVPVNLSSQ